MASKVGQVRNKIEVLIGYEYWIFRNLALKKVVKTGPKCVILHPTATRDMRQEKRKDRQDKKRQERLLWKATVLETLSN